MSDIEVGVLTLLAKAISVLVTAVCMVQFVICARRRGWHVLAPVLIWLGWGLVTFLAASAVLVLANAHTHVDAATMAIRVIAGVYLALGGGLLVHLVRRIRSSGRETAGRT